MTTNENQTETLENECGTSWWFDLSRREPKKMVLTLEAYLNI